MQRMQWFGTHWGASLLRDLERVPIPVGIPCLWCDEAIGEADSGLVQSVFRLDGQGQPVHSREPIHYECQFRSVMGSLGHLMQRCRCHGGDEEDPPELTKRQAAVLVEFYFNEVMFL